MVRQQGRAKGRPRSGANDDVAADEVIWHGTIARRSAWDITKYVVVCKEVTEWYGMDAWMGAEQMPEGARVGDAIIFGLGENESGVPETTWVEKDPSSAGKGAGRGADAGSGDRCTGIVRKRPGRGPEVYFVECPEVRRWYGSEAQLSADEWPAGVDIADEITFALAEDDTGVPFATQIQKAGVRWRASNQSTEEPPHKRARSDNAPAVEAPEEPLVGTVGEVRFHSSEAATAALGLTGTEIDGHEGHPIRLVPDSKSYDGTSIRALGLPEGLPKEALRAHFELVAEVAHVAVKDHGGRGGGQDGGSTGIVQFQDAESAEIALSLSGTKLDGCPIRVEMDRRSLDGTKVRVFGLPTGLRWSSLKLHFERAGMVEFAKVFDPEGKGAGKASDLGGKTGKGAGKAGADAQGEKGGKGVEPASAGDVGRKEGKGLGKPRAGDRGDNEGKGARKSGAGRGQVGGGGTAIAEVRYTDAASAANALELFGTEVEGCTITVEIDEEFFDGTKVRVSGLPAGMRWQTLNMHMEQAGAIAYTRVIDQADQAGKGGKGSGKAKVGGGQARASGTAIGDVRFHDAAGAEAALELFGTEIAGFEGNPLRVEMDPKSFDGTKVRVFGLPAGLPWQALKEHMEQVAVVAHAKVVNQGRGI